HDDGDARARRDGHGGRAVQGDGVDGSSRRRHVLSDVTRGAGVEVTITAVAAGDGVRAQRQRVGGEGRLAGSVERARADGRDAVLERDGAGCAGAGDGGGEGHEFADDWTGVRGGQGRRGVRLVYGLGDGAR